MKVLIVDDNKMMTTMIGKMIQNDVVDISIANDGVIAFDYLKNQDFDLVILDLIIPRKSGFEVLHAFAGKKETKFVVVSGTADAYRKRSIMLGADYFMQKPLNPEKIRTVIKNICISEPIA